MEIKKKNHQFLFILFDMLALITIKEAILNQNIHTIRNNSKLKLVTYLWKLFLEEINLFHTIMDSSIIYMRVLS